MKTADRFATPEFVKQISALCIAGGLSLVLATSAVAAPVLSRTQVVVSQTASSLPGPTYSWVAAPQKMEAEADARVQDPQLRARLQASLDKALQAKGYNLAADPTQADFIVAYRVGVRDVQEASLQSQGGGTGTRQAAIECNAGGCSQLVVMGNDSLPTMKVVTTDIVQGGLLVEVLEPGTIKVLWRALNKGAVKAGDGSQKRLDAISTHTLAELPARSK